MIHEGADSHDSVKYGEKLRRESDPNDAWYTGQLKQYGQQEDRRI